MRRRAAPQDPARHHLLPPFRHGFTPREASIGLARHGLDDWLRFQGLEHADREDLCVVASELCTNAVHAGAVERVELRAFVQDDAIVVEAEDDGRGLIGPLPDPEVCPPEGTSGRGLFLARALVDDLEVDRPHGGTGTIVRCRRRWLLPGVVDLTDDVGPSTVIENETDFAIDVTVEGMRTTVVVRGDIDVYAVGRLEERFPTGRLAGRHVVVDISDVTFIDSTGIASLARCLSAIRGSEAVLTVTTPRPQVTKLLELTGSTMRFDCQGSPPRAVGAE